jgi:hypothetical protein
MAAHRMGESGSAAADGRFSKRDPSLAAGRSLGRNGKVSRFASHTKRKTLSPTKEIGPPGTKRGGP